MDILSSLILNFSLKKKKLLIKLEQTKAFFTSRFIKNNYISFLIISFGILTSEAENTGPTRYAIVVSKKIMQNNGGHHGVLEKECLDPISKCFNFFDSLKKKCICPPAKEVGNATTSWKSTVICQNQNKQRTEIPEHVDSNSTSPNPQFILVDGEKNPNAQTFNNNLALAPHVKHQTNSNQSALNDIVNNIANKD